MASNEIREAECVEPVQVVKKNHAKHLYVWEELEGRWKRLDTGVCVKSAELEIGKLFVVEKENNKRHFYLLSKKTDDEVVRLADLDDAEYDVCSGKLLYSFSDDFWYYLEEDDEPKVLGYKNKGLRVYSIQEDEVCKLCVVNGKVVELECLSFSIEHDYEERYHLILAQGENLFDLYKHSSDYLKKDEEDKVLVGKCGKYKSYVFNKNKEKYVLEK